MEGQDVVRSEVVEIDVRPILRMGGEPFEQIMAAVKSVPDGGALRLRATFMPTPLFHVLGKQGWTHEIERGHNDDWVVLFRRKMSESSQEVSNKQTSTDIARLKEENPLLSDRLVEKGHVWTLDVRTMAPPEPMELTLFVLDHLPKGFSLVQINERVPQFLLPLVEERGCRHEIVKNEASVVELRIERLV